MSRGWLAALLWLMLALAFAAAAGLIFFRYYYLAIFHSDSAAIQGLAMAVAHENSPLPRDFNYGNQLILFRAGVPIALFLKMGLSGYDAFTAGSTLNILLYLTLSAVALNSVLRRWPLSLGLALMLLVPFGMEEADYLIGQQSHLANGCFALILLTQSYRLMAAPRAWAIFFSALAVFCMAAEAPARALLVIAPLMIVVAGARKIRPFLVILLTAGGAFAAGYLVDGWLAGLRHVIGLSGLSPASLTEAVGGIGTLISIFRTYYFGPGVVPVVPDADFYLPFIGFKLLFILAALAFPLALWRRPPVEEPMRAAGFFYQVGFCGLGVGIAATLLLLKEPDVRHFLWSLEICKLGLFLTGYHLVERRFGAKAGAAILCLAAACLSTPISASLFAPNRALLEQGVKKQLARPMNGSLGEIMAKLGVHEIYGSNFWEMLRLQGLFPPAQAGILTVSNDKAAFSDWLTRPSLRCPGARVLYLLGGGEADRRIEEMVRQAGGDLVMQAQGQALYLGDPVWERSACP